MRRFLQQGLIEHKFYFEFNSYFEFDNKPPAAEKSRRHRAEFSGTDYPVTVCGFTFDLN
jgi:hypothetical protein